jgi:hypothetical protein
MTTRVILLSVALFACSGAQADEASDAVKRTCRQLAESNARTIADAMRYKVDPSTRVRQVAESWLEGVQNHMLLAASRADYLSERELAALGYSYCIERRPDDKR